MPNPNKKVNPLSPMEFPTNDVAMMRLLLSAASMLVLLARGFPVDGAVQLGVEATQKLFAKLDAEG